MTKDTRARGEEFILISETEADHPKGRSYTRVAKKGNKQASTTTPTLGASSKVDDTPPGATKYTQINKFSWLLLSERWCCFVVDCVANCLRCRSGDGGWLDVGADCRLLGWSVGGPLTARGWWRTAKRSGRAAAMWSRADVGIVEIL